MSRSESNSVPTEQESDDAQPTTDDVSPLVAIATDCVAVSQFDSAAGYGNWSATTQLVQRHLERITAAEVQA